MKKANQVQKNTKNIQLQPQNQIKTRFEIIRGFFMDQGRLPNYEELAQICGVKSKNAAYKIANACVSAGLLTRDSKGRLAFARPVKSDLDRVSSNVPAKGALIPYISSSATIRLLGTVEAGFPSMAEEHTHDTITLDDYLIPHREASYMLKVKGDSMRDAGIMNGDMVIVERTNTAKPGDIVIARIDGEFTMKYYRIGPKAAANAGSKGSSKSNKLSKTDSSNRSIPYLEAANPAFKLMFPKQSLEIQAVVRSVVRTYGY